MTPLATIDPLKAVPGFIEGLASKTRPIPTAEGGVGIPLTNFLHSGNGSALGAGQVSGTSGCTGYFDAGLAQPRERKRRTKANNTILLETGEKQ